MTQSRGRTEKLGGGGGGSDWSTAATATEQPQLPSGRRFFRQTDAERRAVSSLVCGCVSSLEVEWSGWAGSHEEGGRGGGLSPQDGRFPDRLLFVVHNL